MNAAVRSPDRLQNKQGGGKPAPHKFTDYRALLADVVSRIQSKIAADTGTGASRVDRSGIFGSGTGCELLVLLRDQLAFERRDRTITATISFANVLISHFVVSKHGQPPPDLPVGRRRSGKRHMRAMAGSNVLVGKAQLTQL